MRLSNLKLLCIKLAALPGRLLRILRWLPIRLSRIFLHAGRGFHWIDGSRKPQVAGWWMELLVLVLDLGALPELYETLCDFIKWRTRPLSILERQLASSVFRNAVHLADVRLDERALIGCKQRKIAYVSHFTVNSWGALNPQTFIHELVHVWQYQQMGSAYIVKALFAQKSPDGYDYGGVQRLVEFQAQNKTLKDFNLEQQAEIVGDYYAIREGLRPSWGNGTKKDMPVYDFFVRPIWV